MTRRDLLRFAATAPAVLGLSSLAGAVAWRADLAGLNLARHPSILVEMGNMKNANEAAQMESTGGRAAYAAAAARGICSYLSHKAGVA
ncbi:MAG: N-acetylmuramoyl-L-alanine amidase [Mycobacterium sp.]|nr:N-acetylmuramoyl-L-alanine amidase [Mycobacterium sp.]